MGKKRSKTLDKVLLQLAKAAKEERLVLFVGTGFSKAVLAYRQNQDDEVQNVVPSWIDLLDQVARQFNTSINMEITNSDLPIDCPELASVIIKKVSEGSNSGENLVKGWIAKTFDKVVPSIDQRQYVGSLLKEISPRLIVTTNYDSILENCIGSDRCTVRGPQDELVNDNNTIVYHMHGFAASPDSLVLSREDYVRRMRPGSYCQLKLAMLMREATILFVGYSKNDVNVLLSEEIAQNSFWDLKQDNPLESYRIDWSSDDHKKDEYIGKIGTSDLVETHDVLKFLNKIVETKKRIQTSDEFVDSIINAQKATILDAALVAGDIEGSVVKKIRKFEESLFDKTNSEKVVVTQLGRLLKWCVESMWKSKSFATDRVLLRLEMLVSQLRDKSQCCQALNQLQVERLVSLVIKLKQYDYGEMSRSISGMKIGGGIDIDVEGGDVKELHKNKLIDLESQLKRAGWETFQEARIPIVRFDKGNVPPFVECDLLAIRGDCMMCVEIKLHSLKSTDDLLLRVLNRYRFVANMLKDQFGLQAGHVRIAVVMPEKVFEYGLQKKLVTNEVSYEKWMNKVCLEVGETFDGQLDKQRFIVDKLRELCLQ